MRCNRSSGVFAIAAVTVLALAASAGAGPITIPNAGFEDRALFDPFGDGTHKYPQWAQEYWGYYDSTANGGPARIGNPPLSGLATAAEGDYVVRVVADPRTWVVDTTAPNGVATLLTETFDPDMTYTLTAQVARYVDDSYWAGYLVQLVAGGTRVTGATYSCNVSGGTVIAEDRNTQPVPLAAGDTDEWATSTVVYTPDPADAGLAGLPLQIRLLTLRKPGDPGGDHGYPDQAQYDPWLTYAAYDDVTLDESAGGPPPSLEPLRIDFNSTNQDGGPHNQAGFEPYDAGHEVAADFVTKTYSAFGTTVSVTPDWPNTTDNRVQQMIDRGGGNDANWDNTDGDLDLVTDWLGIDTRTGNGGNGNWDGTTGTPTYMTLTLGGLPAGTYDWKSFHHDTENVHGDFVVDISTDGGTTWEALPNGLMTDSTSGGSPGSEGFDPAGPWTGPDADLLPSTYLTSFIADGTNDVLLRFAPLANTGVHRQIWGINGFELSQAPAIIPEPSTFALAALGLLGLGLVGCRRRRK